MGRATRRLLFCDIPGKRINALSVDDGARASWDFPEVVGSFGLCLSGRLVVALRHHVVLFDPRTEAIENLTEPVDEPATNRFNDGKVGPDGCFWVGSMDERSPRQKTGALYRVTPQGRDRAQGRGLRGVQWPRLVARRPRHVPLGLDRPASSRRGTSTSHTGALTGHRVLATLTNEDGRPDGAAVDVEGAYWSAGPSAGVPQPLLADRARC